MKTMLRKSLLASAISSLCALPGAAMATNGMLMEGQGPISTAMGGASMAFDNGAAAMVNNPATLGMMSAGGSRLDINLGNLRPDVSATVPTPAGLATADSSGDSYLMPAIGWVTSNGPTSYGIGVFSQGGMGTEYSATSAMQGARSEVGVGALLAPLSYSVNNKLNVGGTLQFVWGGMDLIMGMPLVGPTGADPGTFSDFLPGSPNALGSASGTLVTGLAPALSSVPAGSSAVFNFSNDDDFSGEAGGTGFAAKIGFTYQASPQLTLGGAFQSETSMDDWEGSGTMAIVDQTGAVVNNMSMPGTFTIKDFQFPSTLTLGMAYTLDKWLLAADISQINWSSVMDKFNMNFTVDSTVPGFGGAAADITMLQEWDDQTVVKLGAAYSYNDQMTVRVGANLASNPIPDEYMNPLFPATIENHMTLGASYNINNAHALAGSLVIAPEVEQTNSQTQVKTTHSQSNLQIMYSYRF